MASEAILNFDELLQPIPGDAPSGSSTPFTLKQELEVARKEENPDDYDADDPRRPENPKRADWPMIIRATREALTNTSKDLLLAARLTEALTRQHRFAGLRDGLDLMFRLIDQCWDFVYPPITEPDDLEIRAAAFNWLDDPDRGARFPFTVQTVPLVYGEEPYSWVHWRLVQEGKAGDKQEAIEKAINAAPAQQCIELLEDIEACRQLLFKIVTKCNELMGQVAPAFTYLRPAVENCYTFMQQIVKRKGPLPGEEPVGEEGAADEEGAVGADGAPARRRNSREDLYRQLGEIASQLQIIEPHSPIPYLLLKAVELGNLPFPMLMRALIRDVNVISEMNRELGIKDELEASA